MDAFQLVHLVGAVVPLLGQDALLISAKGVDDLGDSSLAAFSGNPAVAIRDRWRGQREGDHQPGERAGSDFHAYLLREHTEEATWRDIAVGFDLDQPILSVMHAKPIAGILGRIVVDPPGI